jgi:hypothetical protein
MIRRFAEWLDNATMDLAELLNDHTLATWIVGMVCVAPVLWVSISHSAMTVFQAILMGVILLPILGWIMTLVFLLIIGFGGLVSFIIRKPSEALHYAINFILAGIAIFIGVFVLRILAYNFLFGES